VALTSRTVNIACISGKARGQWLYVISTNTYWFALMVSLIVVVIVVGLIMAVPFYSADSRDGQDWRPFRLASPIPDTDHPPVQPAKWPRVIARFGSLAKRLVRQTWKLLLR
jgi:hypothetical protein